MRSRYDEVVSALEAASFSIDNVKVRKPFDATSKSYPAIVVHEIVNAPRQAATVTGIDAVRDVAYQLDIQTTACVDGDGNVLSAFDAGRLLDAEVTTVMDGLKLTRRSCVPRSVSNDVLEFVWRGDGALTAQDYAYRL